MIEKSDFFKSYFFKSNKYEKNLRKTKKIFNYLLDDFKKDKIPLLHSFDKEYKFNFTLNVVKKFSKYKNIIIIGMGGSILGTKSIHSFFKKKIKKEVFFF